MSDYSTQQLSAVNDSPGGGVGTGIFLDHSQYTKKGDNRANIGANLGGKTVKNSQGVDNLDFSSPSLYTNASAGLKGVLTLYVTIALAISAVTSILFSYSQHSQWLNPRSHHNIYKNKIFMHNVNIRM